MDTYAKLHLKPLILGLSLGFSYNALAVEYVFDAANTAAVGVVGGLVSAQTSLIEANHAQLVTNHEQLIETIEFIFYDSKKQSVLKDSGDESVLKESDATSVFKLEDKTSLFKESDKSSAFLHTDKTSYLLHIKNATEQLNGVNAAGFSTVSTTIIEAAKARTAADYQFLVQQATIDAKQILATRSHEVDRIGCSSYSATVGSNGSGEAEATITKTIEDIKFTNVVPASRGILVDNIEEGDLRAEKFFSGKPLNEEDLVKATKLLSVASEKVPPPAPEVDPQSPYAEFYKTVYRQREASGSFHEKFQKDHLTSLAANVEVTDFLTDLVKGAGLEEEEFITDGKTSRDAVERAMGFMYFQNDEAKKDVYRLNSEIGLQKVSINMQGTNIYLNSRILEELKKLNLMMSLNRAFDVEDKYNADLWGNREFEAK